jgi:hypothetical protein
MTPEYKPVFLGKITQPTKMYLAYINGVPFRAYLEQKSPPEQEVVVMPVSVWEGIQRRIDGHDV